MQHYLGDEYVIDAPDIPYDYEVFKSKYGTREENGKKFVNDNKQELPKGTDYSAKSIDEIAVGDIFFQSEYSSYSSSTYYIFCRVTKKTKSSVWLEELKTKKIKNVDYQNGRLEDIFYAVPSDEVSTEQRLYGVDYSKPFRLSLGYDNRLQCSQGSGYRKEVLYAWKGNAMKENYNQPSVYARLNEEFDKLLENDDEIVVTRCNNCFTYYNPDVKECSNCHTDAYLMDMTEADLEHQGIDINKISVEENYIEDNKEIVKEEREDASLHEEKEKLDIRELIEGYNFSIIKTRVPEIEVLKQVKGNENLFDAEEFEEEVGKPCFVLYDNVRDEIRAIFLGETLTAEISLNIAENLETFINDSIWEDVVENFIPDEDRKDIKDFAELSAYLKSHDTGVSEWEATVVEMLATANKDLFKEITDMKEEDFKETFGIRESFKENKEDILKKIADDVKAEIEKIYADDKDILEYFHIESGVKKGHYDDGSDMYYVEVRSELGYDSLMDLSEKLDKIVQKYDEYAYFDMEGGGIITAVINMDKTESVNESKKLQEGLYGLPDVEYISHGDWSDGEVEYQGFLYNATDVTEFVYDDYVEYCEENNEQESDEGFDKWIKDNTDCVYSALSVLTPHEAYAIFKDKELVAIYGNADTAFTKAFEMGAEEQEDGFLSGEFDVAEMKDYKWTRLNRYADMPDGGVIRDVKESDWAKVQVNENLSEAVEKYPKQLAQVIKKCWYGNGRFARNGKWSIGLGGYDHGYEVYFDGDVICQIKPNNIVYFGRGEEEIKEICGYNVEQIMTALKEVESELEKE